MIRLFAKVVGPALVLTGIVGIALGDTSLAGLLNIDIVEDVLHIVTGGLLAYVGFAGVSAGLVRSVVGGLGGAYLLLGLLGLIAPTLFGLIPHGYSLVDFLIHLGLGVVAVGLAFMRGGEATTATR